MLRTYLQQLFRPELLGLAGKAAAPLLGSRLLVPPSTRRDDFLGAIASLPDADSPALFGLPANIERSAAQGSAERVLAQLRQMGGSKAAGGGGQRAAAAESLARIALQHSSNFPAASGVPAIGDTCCCAAPAGFDRQEWLQQLSPLLQLWDQLQRELPPAVRQAAGARAASAASAAAAAAASPVDGFVQLERQHGLALVRQVERDLAALAKVLRGTEAPAREVQVSAAGSGAASCSASAVGRAVLNRSCCRRRPPAASSTAAARLSRGAAAAAARPQALGAALLADAVPAAWDAAWAGPKSPQAYLRGLAARAAALEQWAARSQAGALLDGGPLDLSHLFRPRALLNALRQQAARQLRVPMDGLRLATAWEGRRLGGAAAQLQVGGLQIQGAAFDGARLAPVAADAPTSAPVPVMHVAWVPAEAPEVYACALSVPLYADAARGGVLAEVQLPLGAPEEEAQWVLAGVALMPAGSS